MATTPPGTIYADLIAGGATHSQAVILTAIAEAESAGNPAAVGDVALENSVWGPSYGLFQIRTLKAETGTGSVRDIAWLSKSLANQVKAALSIASNGYSPWSTYTSGSYQKWLGTANAAASSSGTTAATAGLSTTLGLPSSDTIRAVLAEALVVALGLTLIGGGIIVAFRRQIAAGAKVAAGAVTKL